jgi:hypothetical protein
VPVPGLVEPDLVVVQAGLVLGLGETILHCYVGSRWCLMRRSII